MKERLISVGPHQGATLLHFESIMMIDADFRVVLRMEEHEKGFQK